MKYRKKPVTIEARQLTGDTSNDHDIYLWVESSNGGSFEPTPYILGLEKPTSGVSIDPRDGAFLIGTLEGVMAARKGDWIIRGVKGEFYPCKPDIFEATYEAAEDEADEDEAAQAPTGGHVLTVTHDHDDVRYAIRCHEPEGADCRIYCPESCETWHIKRDDTGLHHVADGGERHDLVPYRGGCIAVEHWVNEPSPEFVWSRTPRVIGRVPVTPVWVDEVMEWHITDPA